MTLQTTEEARELERIAQGEVCAECGSGLTAPWNGQQGKIVLRCSKDKAHQGHVRPDAELQRLMRMGATQEEITQYLVQEQEKRGRKAMQEAIEKGTTALSEYGRSTALTKEQAKYVVRTIWPDAPEVEVLKAGLVCAQYGLNPLMKHLYLIPYAKRDQHGTETGKTWARVLGIGATRLISARNGGVTYTDGPRRMREDEQKDIFGEVDEQNIVAITKVKAIRDGREAPGYGKYPKDGAEPKGTDKGNSRINMAMIRSERNAIDRLFPGEMPADMGVIDDRYAPVSDEVIEGEWHNPEPLEDAAAEVVNLRTELMELLTGKNGLDWVDATAKNFLGGREVEELSRDELKEKLAVALDMVDARLINSKGLGKQHQLV